MKTSEEIYGMDSVMGNSETVYESLNPNKCAANKGLIPVGISFLNWLKGKTDTINFNDDKCFDSTVILKAEEVESLLREKIKEDPNLEDDEIMQIVSIINYINISKMNENHVYPGRYEYLYNRYILEHSKRFIRGFGNNYSEYWPVNMTYMNRIRALIYDIADSYINFQKRVPYFKTISHDSATKKIRSLVRRRFDIHSDFSSIRTIDYQNVIDFLQKEAMPIMISELIGCGGSKVEGGAQ